MCVMSCESLVLCVVLFCVCLERANEWVKCDVMYIYMYVCTCVLALAVSWSLYVCVIHFLVFRAAAEFLCAHQGAHPGCP